MSTCAAAGTSRSRTPRISLAEHLQRAAGDLGQPGDGAPDRGLARAALAHQAEHLARRASGTRRRRRRGSPAGRAGRGTRSPARRADHDSGSLPATRSALAGGARAAVCTRPWPTSARRRAAAACTRAAGARRARRVAACSTTLPCVHDGDAVGEVGDDAHVVGDQHDRGAELVAAAPQQVEDLGLHRHVERGGRLVGDDQARVRARAPSR